MNETTTDVHTGRHVHIVPVKILLGVWGTLVFLTVITVAASWVDFGGMNLAVALIIATVKATVVALYFMHLRWDKPLNAVLFLAAIGFVMLFVLLTVMDTKEYAPRKIPGNAPGMNR